MEWSSWSWKKADVHISAELVESFYNVLQKGKVVRIDYL